MSRDHAIRILVGHIKDPIERSKAIIMILTKPEGIQGALKRRIVRLSPHNKKR